MAGSDFRDLIRKHENPLQELMEAIPGFDGYRERELRRTADKILRDHLVSRLDNVRNVMKDFISQLTLNGQLDGLDKVDRLERLLATARDSLRFADYGYTGFFDAVKINEAELDRLYDYDASLGQAIDACAGAVEGLALSNEIDRAEKMQGVEKAIEELQVMIDRRGDVATGIVQP